MISRDIGCYLQLICAPVETIQGPPGDWWQGLRVCHQDSRAWRRIQDRRSYLSEGLAYSLSYARQHLLLYARRRRACCFHRRYSLHWRYVYHRQTSIPRLSMECRGLILRSGCGRFFEGNAKEMHKALNETLAALPDDTKVYVGLSFCVGERLVLTLSSPVMSIPRPMSSSALRSRRQSPSRSSRHLRRRTRRHKGNLP